MIMYKHVLSRMFLGLRLDWVNDVVSTWILCIFYERPNQESRRDQEYNIMA